jgi:RNA polymerase sigma-70 factor (ECF subfamily)
VSGGGDEDLFQRLIEPYRRELHAHCYRMLGSLHDADDALQNTLLRAWRALPNFRGESSLRTWLYRIATNACLDAIACRPKRVLPIDFGPAPDPRHEYEALGNADGDTEPDARYERREELELAVIAALHSLSARQRAVLILRDVLGFSAKETAASLETTVAGVNGALLRARRTVRGRRPDLRRQASPRTLGDRRLREIAERFADAFERGEVDAILAMLARDATLAKRRPTRRRRSGPNPIPRADALAGRAI